MTLLAKLPSFLAIVRKNNYQLSLNNDTTISVPFEYYQKFFRIFSLETPSATSIELTSCKNNTATNYQHLAYIQCPTPQHNKLQIDHLSRKKRTVFCCYILKCKNVASPFLNSIRTSVISKDMLSHNNYAF